MGTATFAIGGARFASSCDLASGTLARLGVNYRVADAPSGWRVELRVGDRLVAVPEGDALDPAAFVATRAGFETSVQAALASAGYPDGTQPQDANLPIIYLMILVLVACSVMVYAPIPALVVEVFPARIRYSALSLPYHIGSGWFGGFLPAIAFAITAATGNIYANLWYPLGVTAIGFVVLGFLLPEQRETELSA